MPRVPIEQLPDDARTWVFPISPPLTNDGSVHVLRTIDAFLAEWAAHGKPIHAGRELVDNTFLVIAVDREAETSGCSIDRMFGLFKELERRLAVSILDANRIFYRRGDGFIDAVTRAEFRESGDPHTHVFDTTVERLGEVRHRRFEKQAQESWHARLLDGARASSPQ